MSFESIDAHWSTDWASLVMDEVVRKLPDLDLSGATCIIEEAPGVNRPLQKYLYMRVADDERVFIASFRRFEELDAPAFTAKIVLLFG